jgi:hypothetical protein
VFILLLKSCFLIPFLKVVIGVLLVWFFAARKAAIVVCLGASTVLVLFSRLKSFHFSNRLFCFCVMGYGRPRGAP